MNDVEDEIDMNISHGPQEIYLSIFLSQLSVFYKPSHKNIPPHIYE